MNTARIQALTEELARLETGHVPHPYVEGIRGQVERRLRWHLIRAERAQAHPNVGRTSLCRSGRPRRATLSDQPVLSPT